MTADEFGRWTADEVDDMVRDLVEEIAPDRYEMMVSRATPSSEQAGRTRRQGPGRWLVAAAVIAVGGMAVVLVEGGNNGGGDDIAGKDRPSVSTTAGSSAGPSSTATGAPPAPSCRIEVEADDAPLAGEAVPVLPPRVFRCVIDVAEVPDGGSLGVGQATVLIDDDALTRGSTPAVGATGPTCVDVRSTSEDLIVFPGECDGANLRAASSTPGSYVIEYRLLTCSAAPGGGIAPEGCGAPESEEAGRLLVEVRL